MSEIVRFGSYFDGDFLGVPWNISVDVSHVRNDLKFDEVENSKIEMILNLNLRSFRT